MGADDPQLDGRGPSLVFLAGKKADLRRCSPVVARAWWPRRDPRRRAEPACDGNHSVECRAAV